MCFRTISRVVWSKMRCRYFVKASVQGEQGKEPPGHRYAEVRSLGWTQHNVAARQAPKSVTSGQTCDAPLRPPEDGFWRRQQLAWNSGELLYNRADWKSDDPLLRLADSASPDTK
jgi:hypothetical protein